MDFLVNKQMKHFNLLITETDTAYHEAALKLGLSDSAMLILYTLSYNNGECLLSDITCILSKQTINSALRKLEADDIVYLETLEGRKKKVCLTPQGKLYVKKTVFPLIEIEDEIFDSWSADEVDTYVRLTQRYLNQFKEKAKML